MGEQHPAPATTVYSTTRFGEIEVQESEVVLFPEGLLGFNMFRRYTLIKDPDQEPFLWLQSLEEPDLAFVVVNPYLFFPGYDIQVKAQELAPLKIKNVAECDVVTIVTIPPDQPMDLTTNLRGPLVVNVTEKLGRQVVLIDDRYHTKHFLLKDIPDHLAEAPQGNISG